MMCVMWWVFDWDVWVCVIDGVKLVDGVCVCVW